MRALILDSRANHTSCHRKDTSGGGISIGLVDTIYRLESEEEIDVAGRACCLTDHRDDPPRRTDDHGILVLEIAEYFATGASYYLFLAANEHEGRERIPQMAYGRAVERAIEKDIDVLNVSAGLSRPNCTHGQCAYCALTREAVANGVTVVRAAGNNPDNPVHCPANEERAICVGGVEVECTFRMGRRPGYRTPKPPGAYWTKLWSGYDEYPDGATGGTYCTTRDCLPGEGTCENHKSVKAWDDNPVPAGDKPDVLAPVHYATMFDEQYPFVWAASSFAAPVVTGCLAGTLSGVEGECPPPHEIREAVRRETSPVDSAPAGLFDAAAIGSRLRGD